MNVSHRQMSLDLREPSVPRVLGFRAHSANDKSFHDVAPKLARPIRGTSTVENLIESVQGDDRKRLLEPTSLPKVLRGRAPFRRPQTAIIAYAAQAAYERRIAGEPADQDATARKFFIAHEAKLRRIAHRLRFR